MQDERQNARADFRRMMKWILLAAVVMVAGALAYLAASGDLTGDMVIATVLGVFVSVLLGSGLMAAAYFSDKSGHDRDVNDAARDRDPNGCSGLSADRPDERRQAADQGGESEQGSRVENEHFRSPEAAAAEATRWTTVPYLFPIRNRKIPTVERIPHRFHSGRNIFTYVR